MTDFRVPIPEEIKRPANQVAQYLGAELPKGWGFGLVLFEYNSTPEAQGALMWLSSGSREDMVLAMQEFVRRQSAA